MAQLNQTEFQREFVVFPQTLSSQSNTTFPTTKLMHVFVSKWEISCSIGWTYVVEAAHNGLRVLYSQQFFIYTYMEYKNMHFQQQKQQKILWQLHCNIQERKMRAQINDLLSWEQTQFW